MFPDAASDPARVAEWVPVVDAAEPSGADAHPLTAAGRVAEAVVWIRENGANRSTDPLDPHDDQAVP